MTAAKPFAKPDARENDPHVTPWRDEEMDAPVTRRPRSGGMRTILVWGLAILLGIYVLFFLAVGFSSPAKTTSNFFGGGTVGIIPVHGEISSSDSRDSVSYSKIIQALRTAENDSSISAVLLDIDSGGGSVVASRQVVEEVRSMKKPVVAWIGDVGASGAYYIAASSDFVMADPDSITGSIGVISMIPNVKGLLEKLGIEWVNIKTGELKDIGSPFDSLSDEEKAVFQELVDGAFQRFVSDVKTFRGEKLNAAAFDSILDGRIVSGEKAKMIGLIDETGSRHAAILKAGELGGIEGEPSTELIWENDFTLADLLFSSGAQFGAGFKSAWVSSEATTPALEAK